MSQFFKALEQAERERALRGRAPQQEAPPTGVPARGSESHREGPAAAGMSAAGDGAASRPSIPQAAGGGTPDPKQSAQAPPGQGPDGVEEHLVSLLAPNSFDAEQYRALRYMVEQRHKAGGLSVIGVTSAAAGDGKTTTAINLAGTLAQAPETRVLLVETDLRRPSLTLRDQLGLRGSGRSGLVDAVLDAALGLDDVVQRHPHFNLSVLPAGWRPTAPYEALKSPRLGELLDEARRRYDYIVVDTPPLLVVPDCRLIGKWVDGFLVVVAAHKTPRKLVEEALNILEPGKVVGLIFNGDERPLSGYYGYYYAYSQSLDRGRPGGWGRMIRKVRGSLWDPGSPGGRGAA